MSQPPSITLNDQTSLPAIGFGTYPLKGEQGQQAIVSAIQAGYRLLDSAVAYENEEEVGQAIRRSGVSRDEVLVTTKIRGRDHARADAARSIRESLQRLAVEYIDLHLIHWPNPSQGRFVEAWEALIDAREAGLVRSIGVSNFTAAHLRQLIDQTGVTPAVNQIELHPYFPQVQLRQVHADLGIQTQAWSPMGKRQAPFTEPPVAEAARVRGVDPGQVILRWHQQIGSLPIPKSATPERQASNLDIFDFTLTEQEVADITALGRADGRLFDGDPDTHEEM